ncbi:MAG: hypothetical protein M1826_003515 [Phylliscum demangeonii]|nr:MAG: hypothetical protein M1826_003515 [Phylliscum demangeonii]
MEDWPIFDIFDKLANLVTIQRQHREAYQVRWGKGSAPAVDDPDRGIHQVWRRMIPNACERSLDLDHAKEMGRPLSGAQHRTGSMQFMAIGVLYGHWHTYRNDLEPVFYVFLCACIRYGANASRGKEMRTSRRVLRFNCSGFWGTLPEPTPGAAKSAAREAELELVKDELVLLKASSDGYLQIRNWFVAVYRRQVFRDVTAHGRGLIDAGNGAAHDGDPVTDALLYQRIIRWDDRTYSSLNGMACGRVLLCGILMPFTFNFERKRHGTMAQLTLAL